MAKKYGLDFTDFPSYKAFQGFLHRNKCKLLKTKVTMVTKSGKSVSQDMFGHKPDAYIWGCNGVKFVSEHPGKRTRKRPDLDGALGYMCFEYTNTSKFNKIFNDLKESTSYIKGKTRGSCPYISSPSEVAKIRKPYRLSY